MASKEKVNMKNKEFLKFKYNMARIRRLKEEQKKAKELEPTRLAIRQQSIMKDAYDKTIGKKQQSTYTPTKQQSIYTPEEQKRLDIRQQSISNKILNKTSKQREIERLENEKNFELQKFEKQSSGIGSILYSKEGKEAYKKILIKDYDKKINDLKKGITTTKPKERTTFQDVQNLEDYSKISPIANIEKVLTGDVALKNKQSILEAGKAGLKVLPEPIRNPVARTSEGLIADMMQRDPSQERLNRYGYKEAWKTNVPVLGEVEPFTLGGSLLSFLNPGSTTNFLFKSGSNVVGKLTAKTALGQSKKLMSRAMNATIKNVTGTTLSELERSSRDYVQGKLALTNENISQSAKEFAFNLGVGILFNSAIEGGVTGVKGLANKVKAKKTTPTRTTKLVTDETLSTRGTTKQKPESVIQVDESSVKNVIRPDEVSGTKLKNKPTKVTDKWTGRKVSSTKKEITKVPSQKDVKFNKQQYELNKKTSEMLKAQKGKSKLTSEKVKEEKPLTLEERSQKIQQRYIEETKKAEQRELQANKRQTTKISQKEIEKQNKLQLKEQLLKEKQIKLNNKEIEKQLKANLINQSIKNIKNAKKIKETNFKYETKIPEKVLKSKEEFDKYYGLDKDITKADQIKTITKIQEDIGNRILTKSGAKDIKGVVDYYKSKYDLPYKFNITKSLRSDNSFARIQMKKFKKGDVVTIKVNPNKSFEQQVGAIRHELEHLLDVHRTGKFGKDITSAEGTFRKAYGGKGHHLQYDFFEPDYLRKAMLKDFEKGRLKIIGEKIEAVETPKMEQKIVNQKIEVTEPQKTVEPEKVTTQTQKTTTQQKSIDKNKIPDSEKRISKWNETVRKSKATKEELKKIIPKSEYQVARDKKFLSNAIDEVNNNFDEAYGRLTNRKTNKLGIPEQYSAKEITEAQVIIRKLQNEGKFEQASAFVEQVSQSLTRSGQAIQKASLWNRMTPEGTLRHYQRELKNIKKNIITSDKHIALDKEIQTLRNTISRLEMKRYNAKGEQLNKINKDIELNSKVLEAKVQKLPKRFRDLDLSPAEQASIMERRAAINRMEDGYSKDYAIAKMNKEISDRIPSSLSKKISTYQTMAHLLNFRTAGRNLLGNAGFNVLENVSELLATPLDKAIGLVSKKRTTFIPDIKAQAKGFVSEGKLAAKEVKEGINVKDIGTQYELTGSTFKKGFFGQLEKILGYELKVPDRAFYGAAYSKSISRQMKAAKINGKAVDIPTPDMEVASHLDGLYSTFQDINNVSQMFTTLKRGLNYVGNKEFGLGDIVLKYPKTPGNLIARGIDYSPIGVGKTIVKMASNAIKGNKFNQRNFVINMARGVTGSTMFAAGLVLAQTGILKGAEFGDKKAGEFKNMIGEGKYTLNVTALKRFALSGFNPEQAKPQQGDYIATYDWAQPMAATLSAGANIQEQIKEKGRVDKMDVFGASLASLEGSVTTLAEQPLLMGLSNLNKYGLGQGLAYTAQSIPSGFVPTIVNQARQLVDNQIRITEGDNWYENTINKIVNKIPVLANNLPQSINTKGEQKKYTDAKGAERILNILINPANVKRYSKSDNDDILLQIYKNTGETEQLPRLASKKYVFRDDNDNKMVYTLSVKDRMELQEYIGKESVKRIDEEIDSYFNELTEDEQISILKGIYNEIGAEAKEWFYEKYESKIKEKSKSK